MKLTLPALNAARWTAALLAAMIGLTVAACTSDNRKTLEALDTRPEEAAAKRAKLLTHTDEGSEEYRVLTPGDGLSCAFSQDISASPGYGLSGGVSAATNHFDCKNKAGKTISIGLKSVEPADGKIKIHTENFGTILKGDEEGSFDRYEMAQSQITKLKNFLGF